MASLGFSLKVKTKEGQKEMKLSESATISELKSKISELTEIPIDLLHILIGFPPKPLDLSKSSFTLSSSGISNGDTLIVDKKQNPVKETVSNQEDLRLAQQLAAENDEHMGILLKKVVPADNSCLFTSIGYVLNGKIDTECGIFMREIIAKQVEADKESYNEAILGKPNPEYCHWIQQKETWGGAIEVSILSSFFGIEIDVVDIANAIINRFGEDKNYGMRVFLLFDGIHYDPLFLESMSGGSPKTVFPIEAESVYRQAEQLALEAKSSRQFTDVEKFSLKCIECDCFLVGKVEAQEHAKVYGHTNFGEV